MTDLSWRSALLGIGALQGFVVATLLWTSRHGRMQRSRTANRLLATLLAAVSLSQMPEILGFAGFYDAYPWLSMAPFVMSWSFGPLIWLYPYRLIHGRLPRGWGWWLLPALIQFGYYSFYFLFLPVPERWQLVQSFHDPYFQPFETTLTLLLVAVALGLSVLRYRRYQRWLEARVSDRENYRLAWLRNFLLGVSAALLVAAAVEGIDAFFQSLDYTEKYPLYAVIALMTYYFGFEGYRNADLKLPVMPHGEVPEDEAAEQGTEHTASEPQQPEPRDWAAIVAPWVERFEQERLYLDPDLTLATLAQALATNSSTLSKAINRGLDTNFNSFVNRYRVKAVLRLLADRKESRSLLDLALACGFNSKTSFNRSFRSHTGSTPSAWRAQQRGAGR